MFANMIKVASRFCILAGVLCFVAATVQAQAASAFSGRWVWKTVAVKNKPQTQFTMVIQREGDVISGTYSVDEFINGKWQGEDGNQTPFTGRVTGKNAQIEFDPAATVAGYEQNVTYKPPTDGSKPSVARLTVSGKTLLWRFLSGARIERVPRTLTLRPEQTRK